MAGLLVSGPAGAGKSAVAREVVDATPNAVMVDFQYTYAGLLGIEREPDGRYPEREPRNDFALPLTEYVRRATVTGAIARDLFVVLTNSDGSSTRRSFLLGLLGNGATERVIDPGISTIRVRLSVRTEGVVSEQCEAAISRWYGRLSDG